jgi:small subunit ribosomal protein S6
MAAKNPTYDLVLLLDTTAPDELRKKIVSDADALIKQHGEVIGVHDWGVRPTAYEIDKKTDAEYHLIQFHGTSELLATLDRNLRIIDAVLRFRIIKLAPGTPAPPEAPAHAMAAAPAPAEDFGERDRERESAPTA